MPTRQKSGASTAKLSPAARAAQEAEALRANLARRKAQSRARKICTDSKLPEKLSE
jgi:hypothetical protein